MKMKKGLLRLILVMIPVCCCGCGQETITLKLTDNCRDWTLKENEKITLCLGDGLSRDAQDILYERLFVHKEESIIEEKKNEEESSKTITYYKDEKKLLNACWKEALWL